MQAILRSTREHQAGKRAEWDGLAVSPRYKFRNEPLIEWLEITPEEERQLKTIISGDERRQRDHERDEKRSREAFLPLFTDLRGRGIPRTSPVESSANFSEVALNAWSPSSRCVS